MTFNSWKDFINYQSKQSYYKTLSDLILEDSKKYTIYPAHKDIFNAFKFCKLEEIKVVIMGMDPYHGPNQAHGLSFSVLPGVTIPPSLKNIFKEIESDLNIKNGSNGCLIGWAKQGVLLLNTILTVRQGQPNSHKNKGWEIFTDEAIGIINNLPQPIVFMLWGSHAKSKKELLNNPKHLVLDSVHPSPLSAYNGFFGCKHFSKANQFLINNNIQPIDWSIK